MGHPWNPLHPALRVTLLLLFQKQKKEAWQKFESDQKKKGAGNEAYTWLIMSPKLLFSVTGGVLFYLGVWKKYEPEVGTSSEEAVVAAAAIVCDAASSHVFAGGERVEHGGRFGG